MSMGSQTIKTNLKLAGLLVFAAVSSNSAQETTAGFLKLPVSARALGLGTGITALSDDSGSIAHNPAGLGNLRSKEMNLLYAPHMQGMALGYLAYAQPLSFMSVGVSYLTLRSGSMEGRDDSGETTGSFTSEDRAIGLSLGKAFMQNANHPAGRLRLGSTIKYISSQIAGYSAATYALDLGVQMPLALGSLPMAAGVAVRNLGPGMKYTDSPEPLPMNVSLGAAVRPLGAMVLVGGVTQWVKESRSEWSVGTEFSPMSMLSIRGNYSLMQLAGNSELNQTRLGSIF